MVHQDGGDDVMRTTKVHEVQIAIFFSTVNQPCYLITYWRCIWLWILAWLSARLSEIWSSFYVPLTTQGLVTSYHKHGQDSRPDCLSLKISLRSHSDNRWLLQSAKTGNNYEDVLVCMLFFDVVLLNIDIVLSRDGSHVGWQYNGGYSLLDWNGIYSRVKLFHCFCHPTWPVCYHVTTRKPSLNRITKAAG
jgi:hypothetical protein